MLYSFIQSAIKLKSLPRQGWIRVGIPLAEVESIADHSYNTAMLSLLLADLQNELYRDLPLKVDLVMRIAIIHDLPECQYQDFDRRLLIILGEDQYIEFKNKILINASTELLSLILNKEVKEKWKKNFEDLKDKNSLEAKFVSYVDKLELLIQALSYESIGYNAKLFDDFWESSLDYLKDCPFQVIKELIPILQNERKAINKN